MSNTLPITPADAGASDLAIRIATRILNLDAFTGMRYPDGYDKAAFLADVARMVDSEVDDALTQHGPDWIIANFHLYRSDT